MVANGAWNRPNRIHITECCNDRVAAVLWRISFAAFMAVIRSDLILFYIFIIHWCAILHTSNYLQTPNAISMKHVRWAAGYVQTLLCSIFVVNNRSSMEPMYEVAR